MSLILLLEQTQVGGANPAGVSAASAVNALLGAPTGIIAGVSSTSTVNAVIGNPAGVPAGTSATSAKNNPLGIAGGNPNGLNLASAVGALTTTGTANALVVGVSTTSATATLQVSVTTIASGTSATISLGTANGGGGGAPASVTLSTGFNLPSIGIAAQPITLRLVAALGNTIAREVVQAIPVGFGSAPTPNRDWDEVRILVTGIRQEATIEYDPYGKD